MAPQQSQAQGLLAKADKKAGSSTGWFSSATTKWEEAGDLYQEAANAFKIDKLFKEAGDAFAKEAECRENSKEKNEAANAWWNAAKAYKQADPGLAVQALGQTVQLLTQLGRFRQAADREKEIAQIYLRETNDLRRACESYVRAGDWYAQEDAAATANQCYKEAADLHANLEEYPQAIARYEQVANHFLTSNLTKYNVKQPWLRALLCALALLDPITAKRNLAKYNSQDPTFLSTGEAKFADALIGAYDDQEQFTQVVAEYDNSLKRPNEPGRLDTLEINILLKIKQSLGNQADSDVLR